MKINIFRSQYIPGEQLLESCRKLGANPLEWLRAIVRSVIEKNEYPSLPELDALSQ